MSLGMTRNSKEAKLCREIQDLYVRIQYFKKRSRELTIERNELIVKLAKEREHKHV